MPAKCLFSLGSNEGDRQQNLDEAVRHMRRNIGIIKQSPVYETPPWGKEDQPKFLNMCVEGWTELLPQTLLAEVKRIETDMGRTAGERWGQRLIDIDILFYDDQVIEDENLTVPHSHLTERAFVLAPLADIAQNFIHPLTKKTIKQHLASIDLSGLQQLKK
jgi:2-amino-4-hydroxy-6-hydroxymethyldihydropteridine diphosphokinase